MGFRRSHSDNPGEAYRSESDEVRLHYRTCRHDEATSGLINK